MTYTKPALWLHTLERALGWTTVQQILATFFERWKFKHPKPGDLFQVANEVSGRDLTPFFDQVYRGSVVFDYGVDSVTSTETADETFVSEIVVRRHGDGIFPVTILVTLANGEQRRFAWDGGGPLASRDARARAAVSSRRRSIQNRFCCSTRTSRTTASPPSPQARAPPRNGRPRGWYGCRISC